MSAPPIAAEPLLQATLLGEALDGAELAIFVADESMQYVAVSRYAAKMLGYSRAELLGLRVTDVARAGSSTDEYAELVAAGRREGIATLTRKDGTTVDFRYVAAETRLAGLPLYISVGTPA